MTGSTARLLLLLLLVWAGAARAELALEQAVGRRVTRVEIRNDSRVPEAEIRDLFLLAPGDAYDPGRVQRGLALLAQKPEIRNALVTGEPDGDGVAVSVHVLPAPLVRSVGFVGHRRVRTGDLESRLRTRIDRPVRRVLLERDVEALRELYAEEGFPEAAVHPRVEPIPPGHWVRVVFEIDEGAPLEIVGFDLPEGLPVDRDRILHLVGLEKGDPASMPRLRRGLERLVRVLRREGYLEARVARARFREARGGVVAVIPLVAGERTYVVIDGVGAWAARPLREIVRAHYGRDMDEGWAQGVAERLEERLRADGYRTAAVEAELGRRYGQKRVAFHVRRGPKVRVEKVRFEGNVSLSARRLRKYMQLAVGGWFGPPPLTDEALDRDLEVLKDLYAAEGFLDARVALLDTRLDEDGRATLLIHVDEGRRYRLGRVSYLCDRAFTPEAAARLSGLAPGEVADPGRIEAARRELLRALERRGYVSAKVVYDTVRDPVGQRLDVTFRVEGGHRAEVGKLVISGNVRTRTEVIRRELTVREGAPWNPEEALRSRQRLFRLGFFRRVEYEPLPGEVDGGVRDVRVLVEEQDAGTASFGAGYGTEEGLKASALVAHANLFGTGRSLEARADYDQIDRSYAVNFREPWFLNRRMDLRLSLLKTLERRESFKRSAYGFQGGLERQLSDRVGATLLYTLERSDLIGVPAEAVLSPVDDEPYWLSALGPLLAWDSRDDPFHPRRGYFHTVQAELAFGGLGSDVTYQRYLARMSGYFSAGRTTLALLAGAGVALDGLRRAEVPVNKRFFLGGRTTIRGFDRDRVGPLTSGGDPVGGDVMAYGRAELRFPLWKQLGGVLFWDGGNVWNRTLDPHPDYTSLRHAAGFGVRYLTPVGPLSLDIGFKLNRKAGEDPSVWHFTVGNVF
ncbi:MAG: hypothetical protein Kow0092_16830 [Deferrisomatales bacterium]